MKRQIRIKDRTASKIDRVSRRELDAGGLALVSGGSIEVPVHPPVTPWPQ